MAMLKPVWITAFDLPDAWCKCLKAVLENGHEYTIERGSFKGHKRKELDFVTVTVTNPSNRPLVPEIPKAIEANVPTPSSMEYVNKYLQYLATPIKEQTEDYTYGERLAGVNSDQIEKVICIYKEEGFGTNQACMEVAMPTDIDLDDPPCLRIVDTRVRYGKLHFMVYFRSWDLWAGFPSNLAALQLLKEYMAKQICVDDGEIVACSKGMHLYDYQFEWAKERVLKTK
ncbi:MAG: thymidylate synthase [Candidatus Bathyarchaeota archaeon]